MDDPSETPPAAVEYPDERLAFALGDGRVGVLSVCGRKVCARETIACGGVQLAWPAGTPCSVVESCTLTHYSLNVAVEPDWNRPGPPGQENTAA